MGKLTKTAPVVMATILSVAAAAGWGQAFPDSVKEFVPGKNAGFGQTYFPGNVLGPPEGTLNPQFPNDNPQDLLSLGTGGYLIYEFSTNEIIDEPGPDFTIFENPVQPTGFPDQSFVDSAIVSVSTDSLTWHQFPVDLVSTKPADLRLKSNYIGFAGVQPTYSSSTNGISPFDPAVSGGDQFDLADLGITGVRFVKIQDTGHANYKPTYDKDGDLISDYGNLIDPDPSIVGGTTAGFDLDAMAAIHTRPVLPPSAIVEWHLYE